MFDISGKIGLITGGSKGIGLGIAKAFLESGLRGVLILARNEEIGVRVAGELNREFGEGKAIFIKADVSDKNQFDDAFKKTVDVFKNIDIVVNNATEVSDADWERSIAVHLIGTITGTMLAYEQYIPKYSSDQNGGVIINISSEAGLYGFPATPIYSAAKSGINELTRSLGSDYHYKRTKIKVIAVCPGYTDTDATSVMKEQNFIGRAYFEFCTNSSQFFPSAQPTSAVGKAVVEVVSGGRSGSVWIAERSEPPYEVKLLEKKQNET
ncbi:hypothetical protein RI129_011215 [Pyrocoelia pectoralis]|uniref:Uncharacterized protein n=1 Tax=Pyrocoelia pectoralis TaxID=417401 RepID=A0AAN7V5V0_9COLE